MTISHHGPNAKEFIRAVSENISLGGGLPPSTDDIIKEGLCPPGMIEHLIAQSPETISQNAKERLTTGMSFTTYSPTMPRDSMSELFPVIGRKVGEACSEIMSNFDQNNVNILSLIHI